MENPLRDGGAWQFGSNIKVTIHEAHETNGHAVALQVSQ